MKKRFYLAFVIFISLCSISFAYNSNDTVQVEAESISNADESIKDFIRDEFPIISDEILEDIVSKRMIERVDKTENYEQGYYFKVDYPIPVNFLADTAKILWELNIPEFRSHLFQLYGKDTIYIDTWNNVLGTAKDKTFTGYFSAYRIRNWPSWKDPEPDKKHLPAVPPGPNNPLGLFVVHYDENSLRYFHGTNKNYLIYSKMRNLSHGCVRNDNDNIAKMKEFIIKKVVKSEDLSFWMDSKRSMTFDFAESDRFPVRIIYKTFSVGKDKNGSYIELYKDIYNYQNPRNINTTWNDESLITLTSEDNIINEYRYKIGKNLSDEKLRSIVDYVIRKGDYYEKYYIEDLLTAVSGN